MKIRQLPTDEWSRLAGHPAMMGQDVPEPGLAHCFVAEDSKGEIRGAIWVQLCVHVEPLWVDDELKGGTLAVRLFQEAVHLLDTHKVTAAYCMAGSREVADYLDRLGLELLPALPYICRLSSPVSPPSPLSS